ncbi:MAG TPA: V-type ATP synthase subunit A [Trueperaceae bacterium]|nr:V-type ATP synthase subunit A [Trueperaceae bacterium]
MKRIGTVHWISGPVVKARLSAPVGLMEQVWVGELGLAGEVIAREHDRATIQVYEETAGLRPGEPITTAGTPLEVWLGPGLLGQTFDGIQRPLRRLLEGGTGIERGATAPALPDLRWPFQPRLDAGAEVGPGTLLGVVQETPLLEHRVLVPPDASGRLAWIAPAGELGRDEPLATLHDPATGARRELTLVQRWPVREPRPSRRRLQTRRPLVTGQRVLDTFYPVARGGAAALPGPFGAGKTVLQHSLAKWCDAQVIVYVGCGERGNEIAQVLSDFPRLTDPTSGRPLLERTILIANTSNMPVAAREASIYTGLAMAEYYRDMGYHVALMADSTSRWAEALREIAGRMEEMPAEEGYPAYLPSRLASFYERAGVYDTLSGAEGSVTIIGAVSPPGGDVTEPVTQHTQRFTRALWSLSRDLASARHYPAISWEDSYSFYVEDVAPWWREAGGDDWPELRKRAVSVLEQDARLQQIVRLVGTEALPDRQRWVLEAARLIKEGFMRQNALDPVDGACQPAKQAALLRLFVNVFDGGRELIEAGVPLFEVRGALDAAALVRLKETVPADDLAGIERAWADTRAALAALRRGAGGEARSGVAAAAAGNEG